VQQLTHVNLHRGNIGPETNDLLGVIAHEGLSLGALIVVQSKLLCQACKVTLHHATHHLPMAHHATTHHAATHHATHLPHHPLHLPHHPLHLLHPGHLSASLSVFSLIGPSGLFLRGRRATWMMLLMLLLLR